MPELLVALAIFAVIILVMRFVGAWMLRIDEVITNQKTIIEGLSQSLDELRRLNQNRLQ